MKAKYKVYALVDPTNYTIRYVGSTRTLLSKRLASHIHQSGLIPETTLAQWVNALIAKGLRPIIKTLGEAETRSLERYWIGRLAFCDLLNTNWMANNNDF